MGFDATTAVTTAAHWRAVPRRRDARELDPVPTAEVVVVLAAHPDDETLALGGWLAELADRGVAVEIVVATDDADPDTASLRRDEARRAVAVLHPAAGLEFLGLPDADLRESAGALDRALAASAARIAGAGSGPLGRPIGAVVATWRGDRHGDHAVLGEAARRLVDAHPGVRLLEYPVWLWQWGAPEDVPWKALRRIPLSGGALERKRRAIAEYASQLDSMLVPSFLDQHDDDIEFVFEGLPNGEPDDPAEGPGGESDDDGLLAHFERLHREAGDPWRVESAWYERRKRAVLLAALPRERFASVFEPGCSTGVLTVELARRADRMLACDLAESAVAATRRRVAEAGVGDRVAVERLDLRETVPTGTFDLVVFSELAYYLRPEAWQRVLTEALASLAVDGVIVVCHWRHDADDFQQSAHDAHAAAAAIAGRSGLVTVVRHDDADFVLEVIERRTPS